MGTGESGGRWRRIMLGDLLAEHVCSRTKRYTVQTERGVQVRSANASRLAALRRMPLLTRFAVLRAGRAFVAKRTSSGPVRCPLWDPGAT